MKKQKTHKAIFTWGHLTFNDPYEVIRETFLFANIKFYRSFIRDVLLYSTRKKKYKKEHAGNIIFLLEGIFCLLQACFVISKEEKHSRLEVRDEDILNSNFYSTHKAEADIWSDFPRSLTKAEILDPYKAFGKVYQHNSPDKWYGIMKYLVENAYGNYSDVLEENTLEVYIQLSRLYEAANLIYIREIDHIRHWREDKNGD